MYLATHPCDTCLQARCRQRLLTRRRACAGRSSTGVLPVYKISLDPDVLEGSLYSAPDPSNASAAIPRFGAHSSAVHYLLYQSAALDPLSSRDAGAAAPPSAGNLKAPQTCSATGGAAPARSAAGGFPPSSSIRLAAVPDACLTPAAFQRCDDGASAGLAPRGSDCDAQEAFYSAHEQGPARVALQGVSHAADAGGDSAAGARDLEMSSQRASLPGGDIDAADSVPASLNTCAPCAPAWG